MKYLALALPLLIVISQCRPKQEPVNTAFSGKPAVPSAIQKEHDALLEQAFKLTTSKDSTALKLYELMQHHFGEEEDYVLPPLGILPLLAAGNLPGGSNNIILLTERLKSQMSHMNLEHQMIAAYLDELKQASSGDRIQEITALEREIHRHAKTEEEVYFPAAILVGEYLKLKSDTIKSPG